MDDETQNQQQEEIEQSPTPTARLSAMVLRVLDAGLAALQKIRSRIAPPVVGEEFAEDERRPSRHDDEPASTEAVAAKKSFTRRALTVLMLMFLGAALGTMISYRLLSKQINGTAKMIENMQVEVDETRRDELRNQAFRDKQQQQVGEYRRQLSEIQLEIEAYKSEIKDYRVALEDLNKRPGAVARASRSVTRHEPSVRTVAGASAGTSSGESGNPFKAGSCVTGTANLNDNLINCIEAFNRQ